MERALRSSASPALWSFSQFAVSVRLVVAPMEEPAVPADNEQEGEESLRLC